MPELTRREILAMLLTAPAATRAWTQNSSDWFPLFDGKIAPGMEGQRA